MNRRHPDNPDLFWCPNCSSYKAISAIGFRKNGQPNSYCKECAVDRTRIWTQKNKDKVRAWTLENRDKLNESKRKDYIKHREKRLKECKKYHESNPDIHRKAVRKYTHNNRDKINKKTLAYQKRKYREDPEKFKQKSASYVKSLNDVYIKTILKTFSLPINEESIELKRQQIKMKRTLKQFKQWREQNESSNSDVQGKQHADETNNERSIST